MCLQFLLQSFIRSVVVSVLLVLCLSASSVYAQRDHTIAEIQGNGNISPLAGQNVRTTGIVTARIRSGFFIQTPDDKTDADPQTSEAVYVFTRSEPPAEAAVGNLVSLTGKVEEFRRDTEPTSLTITNIVFQNSDRISVISSDNALPKPITLKIDDFKANAIDQLERLEAMRVHAGQLTVISPTDGRVNVKTTSSESNGVFYAVLKGISRPFREPGLEIADYAILDDKAKTKFKAEHPKLQLFDMNPERLRIESMSQINARPIDVTTNTEISDMTGVLHYAFRANTILVDPDYQPKLSGTIKANPMPVPAADQFSVAAMNIENFFDDQDDPGIREEVVEPEAFAKRLNKTSMAIRDVMKLPDVIGIVEAENINALKKLAEKINADVVASGGSDPKYQAFLVEGNDGRGIDNGFIVKTSRVRVLETLQLGKSDRYKHPTTGSEVFLNDRPPLILRLAIGEGEKSIEFTAVVNHMKSYSGYNDPRQQNNVRLKKRLQAEFLAKWVNDRQKADPREKIILLGDFNSYQFSDGILDMMGTLKGTPAPANAILNASPDLIETDLINLVEVIAKTQQYSYTFDGNAQVLDHILISQTLRDHIKGFGFARVNADFPESFRADGNKLQRFSDHDPAIAYFSITASGK